MASVKCFNTAEKGLNQGYYGGSSTNQNAKWGYKANKYQGPQNNGYAMGYCETESQTAYGMAESWEELGRSYGTQKFQNGNAMSKNQVHGRGNGFGKLSSNGASQIQAYGSSHHSPGKHQGHGYGYGRSGPRNKKHSGGNMGMGQGFNNYEMTEAYSYEESNGYGRMGHSQGHLRGNKHSGHGNGSFMRNQAFGGHGKNMGYEISETETCEYSETHYSNESHNHGGAAGGYRGGKGGDHCVMRKMKGGISGNNSCNDDSEDDSDDDDDYGMRKVWISKAI